jgi:DNA-directed RNA polymerase subunit N (RpoN/RPB10)
MVFATKRAGGGRPVKIDARRPFFKIKRPLVLLYNQMMPVRCINCSKVIGDNWRLYKEQVAAAEKQAAGRVEYLTDPTNYQKTIKGQTMDKLGIVNACCRIHYLTHVD